MRQVGSRAFRANESSRLPQVCRGVGVAGPGILAEQPGGDPDYVVVGSGAGGGTVAARLAEAGLLGARARGRRRSALARAGRLRRPGLSSVRHRKPGDALGLLRPPLRRSRAAGARSEVRRRAGRRLVSARRHARRLHRAQRDDLRRVRATRTGIRLPISPAIRRGERRRCGSTSSGSRTAGIARSSASGSTFGLDPSRHGWSGWLPTEKAAPEEAIADDQVRAVIAQSVGNDR